MRRTRHFYAPPNAATEFAIHRWKKLIVRKIAWEFARDDYREAPPPRKKRNAPMPAARYIAAMAGANALAMRQSRRVQVLFRRINVKSPAGHIFARRIIPPLPFIWEADRRRLTINPAVIVLARQRLADRRQRLLR